MSKIIGTANSSFKGNDGTQITGTTVYTTEPIDPKRGQGESTDHFLAPPSWPLWTSRQRWART